LGRAATRIELLGPIVVILDRGYGKFVSKISFIQRKGFGSSKIKTFWQEEEENSSPAFFLCYFNHPLPSMVALS
jgi:hypothetical protein